MQMHQAGGLQSGRTLRAMSRAWALAAACAALSACSSAPPAPTPPRPTAGAASPTATPTTTTPTPTPHQAGLAGCPSTPRPESSLAVLYHAGQPDDLALDAADLWVSDESTSTVTRVALADGTVHGVVRGLAEPEGVVALPGGDLLVAEQGRDRVVRIHPGGSPSTLLTLPPHPASALGLDGIGLDGGGASLLVPDSPHGTLLSASLGGGQARRIAQNLGRPVGVVAAPDGALYVAAENESPRGLLRVDAQAGTATAVGSLSQLDDVAWLDGLLYATDLRARLLRAVDPRTGGQRAVAQFTGQPQGLAVLADGRLAVADSQSGSVLAVPACG
jgi:streptogramin lyase